jgi:hypothetical protein
VPTDRIGKPPQEFPLEPIKRPAIWANRLDGDFVVKRIEFRRFFATFGLGRAKFLSTSAIVVAGSEMAAWIVPQHTHRYFGEHTSDRIFLALFVPRAVSLNWLSHRTLSFPSL